MELKEAYKSALKEEIQPLIDSGKIKVLGTLEEVVEDLAASLFRGLKKGAKLSDEKWDDMVVPPAADFLESRLKPEIDKIDGDPES